MTGLLALSLRYRFFTLVALGLIVVGGVWSLHALPIDAMPDLTPVQVQVLTRTPSLGPIDVEQFVTFPIEASLAGLPGKTRPATRDQRYHRVSCSSARHQAP